ncbi:S-protein homolog 1-like [Spinacia oleracea]|uniref:S-protein homolog n=1 Tax=Spinacia oleracea TaxID=3562 RepID=A0ABM3QZE6_SPIOL|nr:S-protein homolog 1-like [Spinacia oleracea]
MLKLLVAIILTLGVADQPLVASWSILPARYWVKIENGLSKDILDAHCIGGGKKITDLGLQHIPLNSNFNWTFKSELWKKVAYNCNLTSPSNGHLYYEAYENDQSFEDRYCGGRHCTWKAADDGLYLYHDKKKRYIRLGTWDKP